jgi:chemotaxis protein CheD
MAEALTVGMAELKVAAPPTKLAIHGLGSCVALALYDPEAKVAGIAHAMLPTATGSAASSGEQPGKFCDQAVPALILQMEAAGAQRSRIFARLVGGATMFSFPGGRGTTPAPALGERNLQAARVALQAAGINVTAEEAGGSLGRSLELEPQDGSLAVWSAFQYVRWL